MKEMEGRWRERKRKWGGKERNDKLITRGKTARKKEKWNRKDVKRSD